MAVQSERSAAPRPALQTGTTETAVALVFIVVLVAFYVGFFATHLHRSG